MHAHLAGIVGKEAFGIWGKQAEGKARGELYAEHRGDLIWEHSRKVLTAQTGRMYGVPETSGCYHSLYSESSV